MVSASQEHVRVEDKMRTVTLAQNATFSVAACHFIDLSVRHLKLKLLQTV